MRAFLESSYPMTGARASLAPVQADHIDRLALPANQAKSHQVPAGARFVLFSPTADFYARFGAAGLVVALPSGDVIDGSAAELNPGARSIPPEATEIALISPSECQITLSFYA
jgi:hypothetical protein